MPPAFNAAFAPPTPPSFTEQQLLAAGEQIYADIMHELGAHGVQKYNRRRVPRPSRQTVEDIIATIGVTGPKQHVIITPHMQEIVNDQIHALLPGAFHKVGLTYRGLTRRHTWACTVEEQQANVKGIVTVLGCSYQMMRF